MSRWLAPLILFVALGFGTEAQAQFFKAQPRMAPVVSRSSAPSYTYSYYASPVVPARGYVGYGASDNFPYHGMAYGHPYDPWTWPYMSGSYSRGLARYYDPPVK